MVLAVRQRPPFQSGTPRLGVDDGHQVLGGQLAEVLSRVLWEVAVVSDVDSVGGFQCGTHFGHILCIREYWRKSGSESEKYACPSRCERVMGGGSGGGVSYSIDLGGMGEGVGQHIFFEERN